MLKAIGDTIRRHRQIVEAVLKYGLALGVLSYLLWSNWEELSRRFSGPLNWGMFLIACGFLLAATPITFYRWYILVRAQDLPFTVSNAFRLGLIGFFLSTFLPTSVGGDLIKAAFIAREQRRRTVAIATVLIDRAVGLCALIWLVAIVGSVYWLTGSLHEMVAPEAVNASALAGLEAILLFGVILTVGSLVFWILLGTLSEQRADDFAHRLMRVPKLGWTLSEFWRALWMYRSRSRAIALAMLLSLVGHVGFVMTFYFAARTIADAGDIPTLAAHFLLVPVGNAVQAGVPFPGGIGVGEAAFGLLYKLVEIPFDTGVAACFMQRVIFWILGFFGYLVYLRMKPALKPATSDDLVESANGQATGAMTTPAVQPPTPSSVIETPSTR